MTDSLLKILDTLKYDMGNPLLFNSSFFLFFFIVILLFYPFIVKRVQFRTWFLLLASLYFYYKTSGLFVLLLIATAGINYVLGALIYRSDKKGVRLSLLMLSLIWNLGTLGYYKYTNFIFDTINSLSGASLPNLDIFLPVGISFFTFQT
ncbi:MAG: MBOAT family protein, partial [Candidatus Cloacimonadaceae bacterium]